MLASEVIKRYESYCPQELSMEGDVRGLQVGAAFVCRLLVKQSSPVTPFSIKDWSKAGS